MLPEADYQLFCFAGVECQVVDGVPFLQFADHVPVGSLISIVDLSYHSGVICKLNCIGAVS